MMNWLSVLDRPIAFHPCFVKLVGSVNAALILSQAIYWSRRTKEPDGWFYKSEKEWQTETALSRREQQGARKLLTKFAFWEEERRGNPARLFFRIDEQLLGETVIALAGGSAPNVQLNAPPGATPSHLEGRTPAPISATPRARPILETETTTENTKTIAQALRAAQLADTRRLMSYLARKSGPIANTGQQARAIKWLLDHGYTAEQCESCLEFLSTQEWRVTAATWTTVTKEIGTWLQKHIPANDSSHSSKPAQFWRPINWRELGLKPGDPKYKWKAEELTQ